MTQTSESVTWLTQAAYDQLKAELDYLSGPARTEIATKIAAAREEGDLRENGGYHAAKEEQGKQELRVRQLTQLLENAKVGTAPASDGVVAPGTLVKIAFDGDEDDTMEFLLASREYASSDFQTYSPSPRWAAAYWARRSARTPNTNCRTARRPRSRSWTSSPSPADHPRSPISS